MFKFLFSSFFSVKWEYYCISVSVLIKQEMNAEKWFVFLLQNRNMISFVLKICFIILTILYTGAFFNEDYLYYLFEPPNGTKT